MNPKTLFEYYGKDATKINPNQTAEDRFALPGFSDAATKAGYTKDSYKINMGNEEANNKILSYLTGGPSIVSTVPVHKQAEKDGSALDAALRMLGGNTGVQDTTVDSETDPVLSGLSRLQANSDAATKNLLATTQAMYQNKKNKVNTQYEDYKRGLQMLGIQHNDAEATPDLLAGHIVKAGNDQMEKISELDAEESKALIDAKNAKDTNDFKTLEAKMEYLKQIRQDKANAIKNMYDGISAADKTAEIQAHDIYDTLDTLDDEDKHAFIQEVSKRYHIPLASLVTALADEKNKRESDALKTENTRSIIDKRKKGGTGGGTSSTAAMKTVIANANARFRIGAKDPQTGHLIRGEDGYLDPQEYLNLYSQWSFGDKNFLSNFPVDKYVNPKSYKLLPENLRPAKSSSKKS